jgi:Na+/H+ antiporter NhaC
LLASSGVDNPLQVFIQSIAHNYYAIAAILFSLLVILNGIDIGPMRKAEARTRAGDLLWPDRTPAIEAIESPDANNGSAALMVVPILVMILTMPLGLYVTGDGRLIDGSGSTSILWAVSAALLAAWIMLLVPGKAGFGELMNIFMKGAGALLPIATILLLALALGDVAGKIGTGPYVAALVGDAIPVPLLAPLVFLVSSFIAFSVGSSWGTFAIMIPIVVPIAAGIGLPVPLLLGAAVSGAIFGDHASPISDTTVVASMASATDHIEHVRTQLPYALVAAGFATLAFLVSGWI